MIQEITNGISNAIYKVFPAYPIELEPIEQEFQSGSFLITFATVIEKQLMDNRYYRRYPAEIMYIPKENADEPVAEMQSVQEKLMDALEYITVKGDLVRGINRKAVIVDDVLSVSVDYDLHVFKTKPTDPLIESLINKESVSI